jgi:hypothetical protein
MAVTKPYEFIGFGAMAVTKPYEFIGFGPVERIAHLKVGGRRRWESQRAHLHAYPDENGCFASTSLDLIGA